MSWERFEPKCARNLEDTRAAVATIGRLVGRLAGVALTRQWLFEQDGRALAGARRMKGTTRGRSVGSSEPLARDVDGRARPPAMERLVAVARDLSMARDLDTIMSIVRRAARDLT